MMKNRHEKQQKWVRRKAGWSRSETRPLDIRKGDTVEVLAGRDRGKRGVVMRTVLDRQKVVVEGVNLLKRHVKAGTEGNLQGGIVDFNAPVAYANVQLVCSSCGKASRMRHGVGADGRRNLICARCGEEHTRSISS